MNHDPEIVERKRRIRREVSFLRDSLILNQRKRKSRIIKERLFNLQEYKSSRTIAFFVSFRSEVLTEGMIRESIKGGKEVAVPITDMKMQTLNFSLLFDYDNDLRIGTSGIKEPLPERRHPIPWRELDLIVTPGLAFDEKGGRIGYGGGFYDRLLSSLHRGQISLGVAFEIQMVKDVPMNNKSDARVNIIVTEKRVIQCRNKS